MISASHPHGRRVRQGASHPHGRRVRPGASRGRPGALRRIFPVAFLGLVSAMALLLTPALASADTASTLTVVGTSDVSDSGLMPNVIQPGFQKRIPAVPAQVHRHGHGHRDQ